MRTRLFLALAIFALLCSGCRSKSRAKTQATEEEAPNLASMVHVADPHVASQLVSGFYSIEAGCWRWTAGKFAVVLRPPRVRAGKGVVLKLKFSVPDPIISKLQSIVLAATVNGTNLAAETFRQAGEFTYERDVPVSALSDEPAKVAFALDKALPPGDSDQRELGVVVTAVGFEVK